MRTPLNGILGVLQLLQTTDLDGEQQRLVRLACSSGEMLLDLVNDVLETARMDAGNFHLDAAAFDLAHLARNVREIVATGAEARGNDLIVETDASLPRFVNGDARRLQQVLLNLLANANKFTEGGTIRLAVRMLDIQDDVARIEITVEDSGIGIPADRLATIFTEFVTVDGRYNRRHGGTGLGLAISRRIIDSMGGALRVASTPGCGSRFSIELDLIVTEVADWPELELSRPETALMPSSRGALILLAEDNPTNAIVAQSMLVRAGHRVIMVGDGRDAVSAMTERSFDLVLMDVSMPVMDGLEATELIRCLPQPASDVPIVALTAHAGIEDQRRVRAAGMNDCLTKPIRRDALLAIVARFAGDSSAPHPAIERTTMPAGSAGMGDIVRAGVIASLAAELGHTLLPDLLRQFAADSSRRVAEVLNAADRSDLPALERAAHALTGAAATVGAQRLADITTRLETCCRMGETDAIASLARELQAVQAQTLAALADAASGLRNEGSAAPAGGASQTQLRA